VIALESEAVDQLEAAADAVEFELLALDELDLDDEPSLALDAFSEPDELEDSEPELEELEALDELFDESRLSLR